MTAAAGEMRTAVEGFLLKAVMKGVPPGCAERLDVDLLIQVAGDGREVAC